MTEVKDCQCDNVEHDWQDRFCKTCNLPVKQYTGQEAVDMMHKIAEELQE